MSDNLFLLFLGWCLEQIHSFLWRRTVTTQEGQKALRTGWCAQTHHIYCHLQKQSGKKNFWCIGLFSPCLFVWEWEVWVLLLRWYVIKTLTVIFSSTESELHKMLSAVIWYSQVQGEWIEPGIINYITTQPTWRS